MIYVIEQDGERQHVDSLDGYAGWTVVASDPGLELSDLPEAAVWLPGAAEFVSDDLLLADQESGDENIRRMHAVKQVEAALILSGVPLTKGMIAEEAAALGLLPAALAQEVFDQAAQDRELEIDRRVRKETWRAEYGEGEW